MLLRQRGAERGHRTVEAILMQRDGIHIALREDDEFPLAFLDDIHGEKVPPLVKNNRFRRVQVLRRRIVHDAAAEADDIAAHVDDGEHQAVAEAVIERPLVAVLAEEARLEQFLLRVALCRHGVEQGRPAIRRIAEAETRDRLAGDAALLQIGPRLLSRRGLELGVIELCRRAAQRPETLFFLILRLISAIVRDLEARALCQKAHGVAVGEVLDLHDEIHHAAALMAAEAVENALLRRDGERRRLFAMEGAEAEQVAAPARQRDILPDDVLNGIPGVEFIQKCRGKSHGSASFQPRTCQPVGMNSSSYLYMAYLSVMPAI